LQLRESQRAAKPHVGVNDCINACASGKQILANHVVCYSTAQIVGNGDSMAALGTTVTSNYNQPNEQQICINPDLSPQEAKLAYGKRKLRRERESWRQATDPVRVHANTTTTDLTEDPSIVCLPTTNCQRGDRCGRCTESERRRRMVPVSPFDNSSRAPRTDASSLSESIPCTPD